MRYMPILLMAFVLYVLYGQYVLYGLSRPMLGGAPADPQLQSLSGSAPFASIHDNIGKGVNGSYAGVTNGSDPTKQRFIKNADTFTYYGHGIPLDPVKPGPLWGDPITPHHLNPQCSPGCCPSPYSCDHGCLCVDQQGLRDKAFV